MLLDDQFRDELGALAAADRLRVTRPLHGTDRVHLTDANGRDLLCFSSNDYLGLSGHPALLQAVVTQTAEAGFGAASSRLLAGESPAHLALEAALATYLRTPAALLFPTGYQTNIGVLTALAGPNDLIVSDAANHASIIDGCRLSRAHVIVYPHLAIPAARAALATRRTFRRRFLVTESLFSMDGDRAPLEQLAAAAADYHASLIVDEAHAIGTIGPEGRGLAVALGITPEVTIGTLGKALGSLGGFAAGSVPLRAVLVNSARTFIFTTAPPPALAAAAAAGLTLSRGPEGQERREQALGLAGILRGGLRRLGIDAPGSDLIVPVILGTDSAALAVSAQLLARGILVPAIRPPTVPEGTSRLRIALSAAHTTDDVQRLLAGLETAIHPTLRQPP